MSKCTRWWHCLCRLTPSLATSPVMSTRTGRSRELEVADDLLLLVVRQAAVQHGEGVVPQPQPGGQLAAQPVQRGDPLAEQHDPGRAARADADLLEVADQRVQLRRTAVGRRRGELAQAGERLALRGVQLTLLLQSPEPGLDGLDQRGR